MDYSYGKMDIGSPIKQKYIKNIKILLFQNTKKKKKKYKNNSTFFPLYPPTW